MTREQMNTEAQRLNSEAGANVYHVEERGDGSFTIVAEATGRAKGSAMNALRQMYAAVNE